MIYKKGKCDYCGAKEIQVRISPYMSDISSFMCKQCWTSTKEEYWASNGEFIPEF